MAAVVALASTMRVHRPEPRRQMIPMLARVVERARRTGLAVMFGAKTKTLGAVTVAFQALVELEMEEAEEGKEVVVGYSTR